jgi:hypothetical protein
MFNRVSAVEMQPQVRETVGWLVYECSWYITITWDHDSAPPTLKGGDPKATGIVLLKSDLLELQKVSIKELPLQKTSECHLNSQPATISSEYALQTNEVKNSRKRRKPNDSSSRRIY